MAIVIGKSFRTKGYDGTGFQKSNLTKTHQTLPFHTQTGDSGRRIYLITRFFFVDLFLFFFVLFLYLKSNSQLETYCMHASVAISFTSFIIFHVPVCVSLCDIHRYTNLIEHRLAHTVTRGQKRPIRTKDREILLLHCAKRRFRTNGTNTERGKQFLLTIQSKTVNLHHEKVLCLCVRKHP